MHTFWHLTYRMASNTEKAIDLCELCSFTLFHVAPITYERHKDAVVFKHEAIHVFRVI